MRVYAKKAKHLDFYNCSAYLRDNTTFCMKRDTRIIGIIKNTSHEYLPDAEVFLFGSRARKNASSDSDYDILLITNTELLPKDKFSIRTKIRKLLLTVGIRSDILIQSKSEVEIKKNLPGHIVRKILSEAILL